LIGNPKAIEEQMNFALEIANADFVKDLPNGLDTQVNYDEREVKKLDE